MDGSVGLRSGNDALWGLTGPKRVPEADGVSREDSRGGGAGRGQGRDILPGRGRAPGSQGGSGREGCLRVGGQGLKIDVCPAGRRGHPWSAQCGGRGTPAREGRGWGGKRWPGKRGSQGGSPGPGEEEGGTREGWAVGSSFPNSPGGQLSLGHRLGTHSPSPRRTREAVQ